MTTTPDPSRVPGPSPDVLRRWAVEAELLSRRHSEAASRRARVVLWCGFVVACLAVIVVCVVAVVGFGGSFAPTTDPPSVEISAER